MTTRTSFMATALILLIAVICYFPTIYGDSAIYFTFLKNFFSLPFAYQPHTVSYGATSPLFVLLMAPVHALGGAAWLPIAKAVSIAFMLIGARLVIRTVAESPEEHLASWSLICLNAPLWFATSAVFETGLVVLALGLCAEAYRRSSLTLLVIFAGLFHVIRPELIIIGAVIQFAAWRARRYSLRMAMTAAASYLPVIAYYAYIFAHTGSLMPSSVAGRAITALENHAGWMRTSITTYQHLFLQPINIVYAILLLSVIVCLVRSEARTKVKSPLALTLVFLLPFLLSPPLDYAARYFLPATVLLVPVFLGTLRLVPTERYRTAVVALLAVLGIAMSAAAYPVARRYDMDTLLLADLPAVLTDSGVADRDTVLMYEVQAQYHLAPHVISADGIVGDGFLPFLVGKEAFAEAIARNRITYIVTMNAFSYRPIYKATPLASLYEHDLGAAVGDSVMLGKVIARKVATNPVFADPARYMMKAMPELNIGTAVRVFNATTPAWKGHHPLWNSVYRVSLR
ncbi:MAG: hypothetical protein ACKOAG_08840 [Candidatus Kapaibacterium sp.]